MTIKTTPTFNNSFIGILFELGNRFSVAVSHILQAFYALVTGTVEKISLWRHRAAQRNRLLELDDRQLDDIGLNRGAALREAQKPFWQA